MSNWKKTLLTFKVFLPIIIKSVINLWQEILDAYEENNMQQLHQTAEAVEYYSNQKGV